MNDSVPVASKRIPWLTRARLARLDALLCALLWLFLAAVGLTSGMANIQTDAIDYYAIVQRLVGDEPPHRAQPAFRRTALARLPAAEPAGLLPAQRRNFLDRDRDRAGDASACCRW